MFLWGPLNELQSGRVRGLGFRDQSVVQPHTLNPKPFIETNLKLRKDSPPADGNQGFREVIVACVPLSCKVMIST